MSDENLIELLDKKKHNVKVENLAISIGEINSMYKDNELVLRPEYQRLLKWNDRQKTLLIESLLLGLPIPSIFVSVDDKGKWEVVDGLQRLSTIFDFISGLKPEDTHNIPSYSAFRKLTDDLTYLTGYNAFEKETTVSFIDKKFQDFPQKIQLEFKRQRINVVILQSGTSEDVKYELFQRVNEGGTPITPMEFRRAILSYHSNELLSKIDELSDPKSAFYDLLDDSFSKDNAFKTQACIMYFITLYKKFDEILEKKLRINNIDSYITGYTRSLDMDTAINDIIIFQTVLEKLENLNFSNANKIFTGNNKYSDTIFGAITLGIAKNINNLPNDIDLKEKIEDITNNSEFKACYKRGLSASARIPKMLLFAQNYFMK